MDDQIAHKVKAKYQPYVAVNPFCPIFGIHIKLPLSEVLNAYILLTVEVKNKPYCQKN